MKGKGRKTGSVLVLVIWMGLVWLLAAFHWSASSLKAAYRNHYKGLAYYSEGNFNKAEGLLGDAWERLPENFNFSLAYALCLGRVDKARKGLEVLSETRVSDTDPYYEFKLALRAFARGMTAHYGGMQQQALGELKRAIELQKPLDQPKVLATFRNAMGYVLVHHQGAGSNDNDDLPAHYHVHRRDLEKALPWFEAALVADPDNPSAGKNFQSIADSLNRQLKLPQLADSAEGGVQARSSLYTGLPQDVDRMLELADYEEVAILVDISGSMTQEKVLCMGRTRFEVMRNLGLYLVRHLPDSVRIGIGTVGGDCGDEPRVWHRAGSRSRSDLTYDFRFLTAHGTTPLASRIKMAEQLFPDSANGRRAIFLISDGANVCPEGREDICSWAGRMRGKGITINVLTFLDASFNSVEAFADYGCLADNTGGRIFYLDNLRCAFTDLSYKLIEDMQLELPLLHKVYCWGPHIESLWAIFPEEE